MSWYYHHHHYRRHHHHYCLSLITTTVPCAWRIELLSPVLSFLSWCCTSTETIIWLIMLEMGEEWDRANESPGPPPCSLTQIGKESLAPSPCSHRWGKRAQAHLPVRTDRERGLWPTSLFTDTDRERGPRPTSLFTQIEKEGQLVFCRVWFLWRSMM